MIITNIDPFQPSFVLYPVNDNTTGYKAISLPMILIVPKRLDTAGYPVVNSEVFLTKKDLITNQTYTVEGFKLLIENVPSQALIVGHQNRDKNGKQLRYPDKELYSREILNQEFFDTQIDFSSASVTFFVLAPDGTRTPISKVDVYSGCYFTYRTKAGVLSDAIYYQGALYYDLSLIALNDIILLEDGYYNLVYQTEYYNRNIINQGSLTEYVCIDILTKDLAHSTFKLNHPGEILSEFKRLTPRPYLNEKPADQDETVAFYRPFTTYHFFFMCFHPFHPFTTLLFIRFFFNPHYKGINTSSFIFVFQVTVFKILRNIFINISYCWEPFWFRSNFSNLIKYIFININN